MIAFGAMVTVFNACSVKIPQNAKAIQGFDGEKYLGKWYEIARLDHHFEKNMSNATAVYSFNEDKSIQVINTGYDEKKKKWKSVTGQARFVNHPTEGRLKVSFFKPFWGAYNIIDLVEYRYALVIGSNTNYLWILSREKEIPQEIKDRFLAKAQNLGFATENLIWVKHDKTKN